MTPGTTNRVRSIDVMRGFALMCMVLVHFMVYFGDGAAANSRLHIFFNHVLGDWGAGDLPFLGIIGGLLVGLGLGGACASLLRPGSSFVSDYLAPLSFYPDSFTMILYQLGMSLMTFAGMYLCYDVRRKDPSRITFLTGLYNRTSRFS